MFERWLVGTKALARHRSAPLAQSRARFLDHLQNLGMAHTNLRSVAGYLLQIVALLKLSEWRDVTLSELEVAAIEWSKNRSAYSGHPAQSLSTPFFMWVSKKWLNFEERLVVPEKPKVWFATEIADYTDRMKVELGLSTVTIHERMLRATEFLRWFSHKSQIFGEIRLQDVDAYLAEKSKRWKTITLIGECHFLKAFFRHAHHRGWCGNNIAEGIKAPPNRREIFAPQGPKWSAVLKLLRCTDGEDPASIRAKALLSLYAVYALRSGEALRLRLTDINWERNCFTIRRGKRGGFQEFPIRPDVRVALRKYIDTIRPQCQFADVFITNKRPHRPLRSGTMRSLIGKRMKKMGIVSPHFGPQSLRHACATQLLHKGMHLQDIADFLGHRSCESVRTYAKFSAKALRAVVATDLTTGL
ncbi:MAG TPA: tyrosine-type recombinase/integrase [Candidatus Sulfotelmatobacter sp.]|jgi:integrase/recombinase XerD|nr:tyrosine-type recombinase/integrase [Candidatus Sulfotelmatobacter sp.]